MRNKNMYIDYERSYKRRGRRGRKGRAGIKILVSIIIAGIICVGSFLIIKAQTGRTGGSSDNRSNSRNNSPLGGKLGSGPSPTASLGNQSSLGQDSSGKNPGINPGTIATVSPSPSPIPTPTAALQDMRVPVKVKGIYVTSSDAVDMRDKLINIADTTEINSMVIDVKDDTGRITFMMDSPKAKEIGAVTNAISDIDLFLSALKEKNIYPIARIVAFKDPYLAEHRQELAIKSKDGTLYRDNKGDLWVNPYNREVWDYLVEVASQAAAAGFKEIQFDYIRFSTGTGMSEVDFGPESGTKTKEDVIIEFTKYAYEKLKPLGVFVSADVYGTIISSKADAGLVGQNYAEMAKYLDYICPMIYPSHYGDGNYGIKYPDLDPNNIVRKALVASKAELDKIPAGQHRAIVRPWLQDFTASWLKHHQKYGSKQLREQIDGVYQAGYEEWLLWDAASKYSVGGLKPE